MSSTHHLHPRAWPSSTVVERACAHSTWPFGDLPQHTLNILGGTTLASTVLFLLIYWLLAPKSFKSQTIASTLAPLRFMAMSICILLSGAAMAVYWLVIWTLGCYVERLSNWEAYGWIIAQWGALLGWVFTSICCVVYGVEGLKKYRRGQEGARSDVELQRRNETNLVNEFLAKPAALHVPPMKRPEDEPPTYTEAGLGSQFHTVPL